MIERVEYLCSSSMPATVASSARSGGALSPPRTLQAEVQSTCIQREQFSTTLRKLASGGRSHSATPPRTQLTTGDERVAPRGRERDTQATDSAFVVALQRRSRGGPPPTTPRPSRRLADRCRHAIAASRRIQAAPTGSSTTPMTRQAIPIGAPQGFTDAGASRPAPRSRQPCEADDDRGNRLGLTRQRP